jgi:glutathione synthase/RimK-type ligase-like ATP-grasp enzyme
VSNSPEVNMPDTVLIITNDHDEHADAVVEELTGREVPVFRFHPADFPHACSVSLEIEDGRVRGELRSHGDRVSFDQICGAWYRRSGNLYETRLSMTSERLDNYVKTQAQATVSALCSTLDTLWVSHPLTLRRGEVKALQLVAASRAGLKIPHTLISNDPERAAPFVAALGDVDCAIKPLLAVGVTDDRGGFRMPLTAMLPRGHSLESVALAPTILQPYVDKAFELRCVVIGEEIFAAKMDTQADEKSRVDSRGGDPDHEIFELPDEVKSSLRRLMDFFGLNFASLDMIVTPDGEFVFLELNPNGQWLWLELALGLPLVAAMADLLTSGVPAGEDVKGALSAS